MINYKKRKWRIFIQDKSFHLLDTPYFSSLYPSFVYFLFDFATSYFLIFSSPLSTFFLSSYVLFFLLFPLLTRLSSSFSSLGHESLLRQQQHLQRFFISIRVVRAICYDPTDSGEEQCTHQE